MPNPELETCADQQVLELIGQRVELKTKLAAVSIELCRVREEYLQIINDIIQLNRQIGGLENRQLITDIVCGSDLDIPAQEQAGS